MSIIINIEYSNPVIMIINLHEYMKYDAHNDIRLINHGIKINK